MFEVDALSRARRNPKPMDALWKDLSELLTAFGEIQDRLDPTLFSQSASRIEPLAAKLELSRNEAERSTQNAPSVDVLLRSASQALQGAARFLEAPAGPHGIMKAFQALRPIHRSEEILYSLAGQFEEVSKFFLPASHRENRELLKRLSQSPSGDIASLSDASDCGIIHFNNERGKRGRWSIYVPEYYTKEKRWPLVIALHGGSGHGADFLWSWLRDARARGMLLASPTSLDRTWFLHHPGTDVVGLNSMLSQISEKWNVDTKRLLLTGISDGGTYSMVLSTVRQSPFTHYAPVAAAVHALLNREGIVEAPVADLKIFQVHGARDWMFPVEKARLAASALKNAGANIVYREVEDLSHNYPRDLNAEILDWFTRSGSDLY